MRKNKHPQVWDAKKDTKLKNMYIKHSVSHEKKNEKETFEQKLPVNMNHG